MQIIYRIILSLLLALQLSFAGVIPSHAHVNLKCTNCATEANDESWAEVVSVEIEQKALKAYNLTVADFHTYFVRGAANDNAQAVWVHNDCFSKIKESPLLAREAQRSGRNVKVQDDIDKLTAQLSQGNANPGIGTKPIGKGISEARGRNGGRVYFRVVGDNVQVLGKSGKDNQQRVIKEVLRVFGE